MKKIFFALLSLGISAQAFAKTDNEQVDSLRSQNLEPVTVYSTRTSVPLKLVPAKLEVIPARNIEQSGFTNMTDLLKSQSSLDVTQYPGFNSNIGIRGFKPSGKYVNVLVNGIPAGTDNISTLSVQDIEQIEILKGPFSSIYGTNAMGGIINVITKKSKDKVRGNVSFGGGSYETIVGAFNMGGRFEDIFSFDLSVGLDKQNRAYKTGTKNFLSLSPLEELIVDPKTQGQKMENSDYTIGSGRL
uniref:TonB-dependent receptor plug domain-containing protein n=1 Tax=Porphyromonas loveana TaxID=1884669 RepID=UPI0035A0E274